MEWKALEEIQDKFQGKGNEIKSTWRYAIKNITNLYDNLVINPIIHQINYSFYVCCFRHLLNTFLFYIFCLLRRWEPSSWWLNFYKRCPWFKHWDIQNIVSILRLIFHMDLRASWHAWLTHMMQFTKLSFFCLNTCNVSDNF